MYGEVVRVMHGVDDEYPTVEEVPRQEPAHQRTGDYLHEEAGFSLYWIVSHLGRLELHHFDALTVDPLRLRVLPELVPRSSGCGVGAHPVQPPLARGELLPAPHHAGLNL